MRLIVLDDTNCFRRVALEKFLLDFSYYDNNVVIANAEEARCLIKHYCRRYQELYIIGALTCQKIKSMVVFFSKSNPLGRVKFLLFSDMIGLKKLKHNLLIGTECVFVSPDIHPANFIELLCRQSYKSKDKCIPIEFDGNDHSIIAKWRRKLSGRTLYAKMTRRDYYNSRCLKNKLHIQNEYALCLLWHFVRCTVSDYPWVTKRTCL